MGRGKITLYQDSTHKVCAGKECIHKGKLQSIKNFNKYKKDPTGIYRYCKDCTRKSFQKHYYDNPPIKHEDNMSAIIELAKQVPVEIRKNNNLLIRSRSL